VSFHQEPKDELVRLIRESREKSEQIVQKSDELAQFGQYMTDLANASEKAIRCVIPSGIDLEPKIDAWSYANQQQDAILAGMMPISIPTATTFGITVAYSMSDLARPSNIIRFVPPDRQDQARIAADQLSHVIDRLAEKNKVLSLLCQYGLTGATPGGKSPAELFEMAYAAFEKPVTQTSPATTSLIPMRECINGTIVALLRHRPKQEIAKSQRAKVLSICAQLAGHGVSQREIESLAQRWESLLNELSSSKQRDYLREDWGDCLRRASLFLLEFLQTLDRSRMKD